MLFTDKQVLIARFTLITHVVYSVNNIITGLVSLCEINNILLKLNTIETNFNMPWSTFSHIN